MPTRWINQSQPQPLVSATLLLYMNAVLALVFGDPLFVLKLAGVAGALGVANEKKWGYIVAAVVAIVPLVLTLVILATGTLNSFNFADLLISLLFELLLVGFVFHPASRNYQRIWFK
jgi:hypothetical protein